MFIKITKHKNKDLKSIAPCDVAVAHEEHEGVHQVTALVKAYDAFQISTVVASLRLSPKEARALASQLMSAADQSETDWG